MGKKKEKITLCKRVRARFVETCPFSCSPSAWRRSLIAESKPRDRAELHAARPAKAGVTAEWAEMICGIHGIVAFFVLFCSSNLFSLVRGDGLHFFVAPALLCSVHRLKKTFGLRTHTWCFVQIGQQQKLEWKVFLRHQPWIASTHLTFIFSVQIFSLRSFAISHRENGFAFFCLLRWQGCFSATAWIGLWMSNCCTERCWRMVPSFRGD